jgi:hypothetical protein
MSERVDHAVREAVHIDVKFPSLVQLAQPVHNCRTIIVGGRSAEHAFGELNIAGQTHGVEPWLRRALRAQRPPQSPCRGLDIDVRVSDFH